MIVAKSSSMTLACKEPRPEWGVSGIEFREGEPSLFRMLWRCRPDAFEIAEESDLVSALLQRRAKKKQ
jgi:hypothetical protein